MRWSIFLVKIRNQAGVTAELAVESPNSVPVYKRSSEALPAATPSPWRSSRVRPRLPTRTGHISHWKKRESHARRAPPKQVRRRCFANNRISLERNNVLMDRVEHVGREGEE